MRTALPASLPAYLPAYLPADAHTWAYTAHLGASLRGVRVRRGGKCCAPCSGAWTKTRWRAWQPLARCVGPTSWRWRTGPRGEGLARWQAGGQGSLLSVYCRAGRREGPLHDGARGCRRAGRQAGRRHPMVPVAAAVRACFLTRTKRTCTCSRCLAGWSAVPAVQLCCACCTPLRRCRMCVLQGGGTRCGARARQGEASGVRWHMLTCTSAAMHRDVRDVWGRRAAQQW